jgi:hypothetical protein
MSSLAGALDDPETRKNQDIPMDPASDRDEDEEMDDLFGNDEDVENYGTNRYVIAHAYSLSVSHE